jgi:hypothetical protein
MKKVLLIKKGFLEETLLKSLLKRYLFNTHRFVVQDWD